MRFLSALLLVSFALLAHASDVPGEAHITWTNPTTDVTGKALAAGTVSVQILRGANAATLALIATVPATASPQTYVDKLPAGGGYCWGVSVIVTVNGKTSTPTKPLTGCETVQPLPLSSANPVTGFKLSRRQPPVDNSAMIAPA